MKKISLILIVTFFIIGTFGCKKTDVASLIGNSSIPTEYYYASFVIDVSDTTAITTYVNYVFVGQVESYEKTEYIDEDHRNTYYSVKVLENIKGELVTDKEITVRKTGGIDKNKKKFVVCDGDALPEVGKTYVFATYVYDDELHCFGPGTTALIEDAKDYKESEVYKSYVDACKTKHPETPEREKIISKYDTQYMAKGK